MSSLLYAELAATCNALGYFDGNKYYIDTYCQETVKDLIRYLRRDDENHEIRRHLGEAKILQSDLLPILKDHWEKKELFDVVLRLLVNLTNPALLLYREELPAEKTSRNYYLQIINHLQSYKEAFCDNVAWAILSKKLGELLQIDSLEREEEKGLIIERILILARNVLQVPADPEVERRADNDASIHDQLLWTFHQSGMVDLFLYIASSENEQQYYMHILEIVSLMLREQNPTQLADAAVTRTLQEKERDEVELLAIRQEEIRRRQEKVKKFTGARHSRFGGTYVLKDMKSVSDNDLIYHKPLNKLDSLDFDHDKVKQKRPKNRLPMRGENNERRSVFSVRLFLKEFCVEFLNGAYNTLMYHVKDGLVRAKAQANDESYYMWALKFFMEFNRNYKFQVKLVSETMSVQTFHFIQTQLEKCYDMLTADKKKLLLWSRRLHLALRAYQELLMTLMAMDKCDDPAVRESSKVIKSNIFYVVEYRELILILLLNFDEIKFSKLYLKDLIETAHVFLKLLEQFCAKRSIVVQRRKTARKKKTKKSKPAPQETAPARDPEEQWDEVSPQLSAVLQSGAEIPNVVPFDAASERHIDEQRVDAMVKIQNFLRDQQFEEAIGLLRAAREVWPENDCFGSPNMAPEEEFLAMKDIFLANIQDPNPNPPEQQPQEDEEEEEDEEDEEDESAGISVAEQDFKFMDFLKRFAHHKVVMACSLLMQRFDRNLAHTNHCIVKLLHKIAWNCKMPSMLFQASLFRTFQRILDSKLEHHKELAKFAVFIIRKFAEVAQKNGKVYMELLFWKTMRDAYEIEEGYGSYQEKSQSSKKAWTEEEEEELRRLHEEFTRRANAEEGENDVGMDMVDWIVQNLINTSRSHRGVAKKLRELGYEVTTKSSKKTGNKRPPRVWAEEEEQQLRELYEEFKIAIDPLGCIVDRLAVRRPKQRIADKLLEMGLVQDKKELRKKRVRKQRAQGAESEESGNSDDDVESDEDSASDGDGNITVSRTPAPKPAQRKGQGNARKASVTKTNKKKTAAKQYSSAELATILTKVVAAGMSEALQWLSSSLEEVADDRETDVDEENIPLLPLTEETITAMEDSRFQELLKAVGVAPPFDEQEVYWRIPGHLSVQDLRKRVEIIAQALDGRLVAPTSGDGNADNEEGQNNEDEIPSTSHSTQDSNIDVDDNNLEQISQKSVPKHKKHREKKNKTAKSEENVSNKSASHSGKKHSRKVIRMDSDSETDEVSLRSNEEVVNEPHRTKNTLLDLLSDSETEQCSLSLLTGEANTSTQVSRNSAVKVLSDSDSETEHISLRNFAGKGNSSSKTSKNTARSVLNDSDSEEERTNIDIPKPKNKRIHSDSEEEKSSTVNAVDIQENDSDIERKTDMRKRLRMLASDDED